MSSSQHKNNHPIAPSPTAVTQNSPVQSNEQFFNFESSSYGYGYRNWSGEQNLYNRSIPQMIPSEVQTQQEMDHHKQLVEQAKTQLMARFPFYAINLQNDQSHYNLGQSTFDEIPMPVEAPSNFERYGFHSSESEYKW